MSEISPIMRIYDSNNGLLFDNYYDSLGGAAIKSLRYVYDEKLEDTSTVVLASDNPKLIDLPELQEDKAIFMEWGKLPQIPGEKPTLLKEKGYIMESSATFNDSGIELTLKVFPKAAYLKKNKKTEVDSETDLPTFVEKVCGVAKINVVNEIVSGESIVIETGFSRPTEQLTGLFQNPENPNDPRNGTPYNLGIAEASDSARVRKTFFFKKWPTLPQAHKSDGKTIEMMRDQEPIPNLVVSGRGDNLTIKVRDLERAPDFVLKYSYPGNSREELPDDVYPAFKVNVGVENKTSEGAATSTVVDGWDIKNKRFISGEVNNSNDGQTALASKVKPGIESVLQNNLTNYPGDSRYYGLFEEKKSTGPNGEETLLLIENDELNGNAKFVYRIQGGMVSGALAKDGYLLERDVTGRIFNDGIIPIRAQDHIHTAEDNPTDIAGVGVSRLSNAALCFSEGTLETIACPLKEGQVIRIENIGRKYSGNWYVKKAEHDCSMSGWWVTADITRNANNEGSEQMLDAEELNKDKNTVAEQFYEDALNFIKKAAIPGTMLFDGSEDAI